MELKSRDADFYSELHLYVKKTDLRSLYMSHETLQSHQSSQALWTRSWQENKGGQSGNLPYALHSPQSTKNSGIPIFQIHFFPSVSQDRICMCSYQLKHTQMIFKHQKPTKNTFFHRNHFSSKISCGINVFHANALFIYHFSLSSEKIIIVIVIIMPQEKRIILGSSKV